MKAADGRAVVEVLDAGRVGGRLAVIGRLAGGDLDLGTVLEAATGDRWMVTSFAFVPAQSLEAGLRFFGVAPRGPRQEPVPGEILLEVPGGDGGGRPGEG